MSTTDCSRAKNWGPVISNALLFSEELKTEFVLCDGQFSFSHWILQVEPSPCLVATFSMTWTLPWQNRQDTDSSIFSSSFSLDTIARPFIVFHVPSADGVDELNWLSSSGSSSWILERLALPVTAAFSLFWISNSSSHFSCWYKSRPVTRGGARGAFAPPHQASKVRILILNIQVKECSRLNWSFKLNSDI